MLCWCRSFLLMVMVHLCVCVGETCGTTTMDTACERVGRRERQLHLWDTVVDQRRKVTSE